MMLCPLAHPPPGLSSPISPFSVSPAAEKWSVALPHHPCRVSSVLLAGAKANSPMEKDVSSLPLSWPLRPLYHPVILFWSLSLGNLTRHDSATPSKHSHVVKDKIKSPSKKSMSKKKTKSYMSEINGGGDPVTALALRPGSQSADERRARVERELAAAASAQL
ncbi:hypothetical protein PG993_006916 [Apiospora rasikravindrae]|uniref:Uncharacterized protein n=1 Tax=Apiospora rasikravindrae TaxID=990691 RepID=A0ABR1SW02_9PEZI